MVTYYKLDKVYKTGTTYETDKREVLIIQKIGTDATEDVIPKIGGVSLGPINTEFAPLHKTSSNLLGPLDLGELYYVIPPETRFEFVGPSGAKVRVIGKIGKLAVGEAVPSGLLARYDEQGKHYLTYVKGSFSFVVDEAWAADREVEVLSITPKTIEKYIFKYPVMAKVENLSISEGQIGVRFYLDEFPLDIFEAKAGHKGIDILSMPYPPADSTEEEPFTLAELPIELLGDHTLKVTAINVSGSSLSPASGTAIKVTALLVAEYIRTG